MRIVAVAVASAIVVSPACSSESSVYQAPETISITTSPTSALAPTAMNEPELDSFDEEAVEVLLNALTEDAAKYGWVAGCIWPEGVSDNDTLYPAVLLGIERTTVASGTWGFTAGPRVLHVATIYRPSSIGFVAPVNSFEKKEAADHLCYIPAPH